MENRRKYRWDEGLSRKKAQEALGASQQENKAASFTAKAASAALSELAFHQGALRSSALQLPPLRNLAVLHSFFKTFVFLFRHTICGFRVFLTQKAAIIVDIYKNLEFSESP